MFKHKAEKIVIAILFVFLSVYGLFINYASAAINEEYYSSSVENSGATDSSIDTKINSSTLVNLIGNLIYGIGSLMEWLLGALFSAATGTNIFPWADVVVFNAIPLLDANFINPDSRSMVSVLGNMIPKVYATIFSLAVSFFTVVILIMALKLVTSTIAEKKASYKTAIVSWLMGLLLLFSIHFFMSFVLYLNEQFVKIASEMVDISPEIAEISAVPFTDEELVDNFVDAMTAVDIWKVLIVLSGILGTAGAAVAVVATGGLAIAGVVVAVGAVAGTTAISVVKLNSSIRSDFVVKEYDNVNDAKNYLKQDELNIHFAAALLKSSTYTTLVFNENAWYSSKADDSSFTWKHRDKQCIMALASSVSIIRENNISDIEKIYNEASIGGDSDVAKLWKIYIEVKREVELKQTSKVSLYANLAQFFKKSAFSFTETGWRASKVVVQNALLYAIFVVQSVIFFISYIKRMIHIVILGLMAPLVVVADSLKKL